MGRRLERDRSQIGAILLGVYIFPSIMLRDFWLLAATFQTWYVSCEKDCRILVCLIETSLSSRDEEPLLLVMVGGPSANLFSESIIYCNDTQVGNPCAALSTSLHCNHHIYWVLSRSNFSPRSYGTIPYCWEFELTSILRQPLWSCRIPIFRRRVHDVSD